MANSDKKEKISLETAIGIGPGRGSERLAKRLDSDAVDQSKHATRSASETAETDTEEDDVNTAGGREGNFAESERGDEEQWSPGSTQPSDQ